MARRGFSKQSIAALKKAFRILYRMDYRTEQALEKIEQDVPQLPEVLEFSKFVATTKRGIVR